MKHDRSHPILLRLGFSIALSMAFAKSTYAISIQEEAKRCGSALKEAIQQNRFTPLNSKVCPLSATLLDWMRFRKHPPEATFPEIIRFLAAHPHWPSQHTLRIRAEQALTPHTPLAIAKPWFDKHPPLVAQGVITYGKILYHAGHAKAAQHLIKKAWATLPMTDEETASFLSVYGKSLSSQDHVLRVDTLLQKGQVKSAQSLVKLLSPKHKAFIEARISLNKEDANALSLLGKVPVAWIHHPGLLYDQIKWYRKKKETDKAVHLLNHFPAAHATAYREGLWTERNILARRLFEEKRFKAAYALTLHHGQKDGESFATAEWMAGWFSLRFLDKPQQALTHFQTLYKTVGLPISRSRAAYWLAETYAQLKQKDQATAWYRRAMAFPSTFYGQLAATRLNVPLSALTFGAPAISQARKAAFYHHTCVRAVRFLGLIQEKELMTPFLYALSQELKTVPEKAMLVSFAAQEAGRHAGVWVAKTALEDTAMLLQEGFPVLSSPLPEHHKALIHAIIHRESRFNPKAQSPAGAKGLMQIMPTTAPEVAQRHGLGTGELFDPAYNVRLGSAFLEDLRQHFSGHLVLMIAAYNAGKTPVTRWVQELGDPRTDSIDIIDWIESIPYGETRNYVQRVIESLVLYYARLGVPYRDILQLVAGPS